MDKDSDEVEDRWVENTEGQWTVMQQDQSNFVSHQPRIEDEPVTFETGERHEKEIDDVQRIVNPCPDCTEGVTGRTDSRGVHVSEGERQSNCEKEKRNDEKKRDSMMMVGFSELPLSIELTEDKEIARHRKELQSQQNAEFQSILLDRQC